MIAWLAERWPFGWAYTRGYCKGRAIVGLLDRFEREDLIRLRRSVRRISVALNNNVDLQDLVEVCTETVQIEREMLL